jgi:hypothetical protein
MAEEIRRPSSAIQVSRRGASRLPNLQEARALALGALWTLYRTSGGIKIANTHDANGKSLAVVLIENAAFKHDEQGFSNLIPQDKEPVL